jgi:uncharacterized protein
VFAVVEPVEDLRRAVDAGDVEAVRAALAAGADPSSPPPTYWEKGVLAKAASHGPLEVVTLLLDAGADPNGVNAFESTPLRAAASYGRNEVVRVLLGAGADLTLAIGQGGSILMEAVSATCRHPSLAAVATVELLLEAGATVRPSDDDPVVLAIEAGAPAAVLSLLLAYGSSPDVRRHDSAPALVVAVKKRDEAALQSLLAAGAKPDAADRDGRTALMHAVERDMERSVAALMCAGANPELTAMDGSTAEGLARTWQRPVMRAMFGETNLTAEMFDQPRTVMEFRPARVRLCADATAFDYWSRVVEHSLTDIGDDELETLWGFSPADARRVAAALARDYTPTGLSHTLMQLELPTRDLRVVYLALGHLAYGSPTSMPRAMTQTQVLDMFEDIRASGII